ncbi:MAG: 30S ribosome-binding factor RbfA [Anaerolineales bacterium]|nr:30S ribosome-binding factor RbfA [Anaerolineales bacterium]
MVSESRADRIADRIKRELSVIFLHEIEDPRLEGVNVTSVDVDRELAYADVYVSALDGSERKEEILRGLKNAQGFLRSQLANSISHLRSFPHVRFHWDPIPERADRIDQLISELEAEEKDQEGNSEDE